MPFFNTHSGRATVGVVVGVWFIAHPPPLAWFPAAAILYWSACQFRAAFALADQREPTDNARVIDVPARIVSRSTLRRRDES